MEGTFSGWVGKGDAYGFVTPDSGEGRVFVHRNDIKDSIIGRGARLSFDVLETPKGPKATNVTVLTFGEESQPAGHMMGRGRVEHWKERGFGFIAPESGGEDVFVHVSVLPREEEGYLCDGYIVEYQAVVDAQENKSRATAVSVVGWDPPPDDLAATVDMGPPSVWPAQLAKLAEPEPWEYKLTANPESYPILRSYIRYTFRRLREMSDGISVSKNGRRAAFNTGLVTMNQEDIFGVLMKNQRAGRQEWRLAGFKKASDRDVVENFGDELPPLADYFDDPSVLLYDRRCNLIINIDHVLENIDRFPKALQENTFMTRQLLEGAQATMRKRVYRNYKTAIPQYYRDKGREGGVQLLLPICLTNPAKADLALVVNKNRDESAYLGSTVLTLDMAYNNARLLSRPDMEWLQP